MQDTSLKYKLISALLAFFLWGGWALYANAEHGTVSQLVAAATQGTMSLLITLFILRMITGFKAHQAFKQRSKYLPGIVTFLITSSGLIGVHLVMQTPNIAATTLPPLSVALIFCLYTCHKLSTQQDSGFKEASKQS
ncbi:MAG: hypothetical protein NXI13_06210 [Proteobacteria bacterium]|nr:hypothetical protein [Pseudomonadota bacterium]